MTSLTPRGQTARTIGHLGLGRATSELRAYNPRLLPEHACSMPFGLSTTATVSKVAERFLSPPSMRFRQYAVRSVSQDSLAHRPNVPATLNTRLVVEHMDIKRCIVSDAPSHLVHAHGRIRAFFRGVLDRQFAIFNSFSLDACVVETARFLHRAEQEGSRPSAILVGLRVAKNNSHGF